MNRNGNHESEMPRRGTPVNTKHGASGSTSSSNNDLYNAPIPLRPHSSEAFHSSFQFNTHPRSLNRRYTSGTITESSRNSKSSSPEVSQAHNANLSANTYINGLLSGSAEPSSTSSGYAFNDPNLNSRANANNRNNYGQQIGSNYGFGSQPQMSQIYNNNFHSYYNYNRNNSGNVAGTPRQYNHYYDGFNNYYGDNNINFGDISKNCNRRELTYVDLWKLRIFYSSVFICSISIVVLVILVMFEVAEDSPLSTTSFTRVGTTDYFLTELPIEVSYPPTASASNRKFCGTTIPLGVEALTQVGLTECPLLANRGCHGFLAFNEDVISSAAEYEVAKSGKLQSFEGLMQSSLELNVSTVDSTDPLYRWAGIHHLSSFGTQMLTVTIYDYRPKNPIYVVLPLPEKLVQDYNANADIDAEGFDILGKFFQRDYFSDDDNAVMPILEMLHQNRVSIIDTALEKDYVGKSLGCFFRFKLPPSLLVPSRISITRVKYTAQIYFGYSIGKRNLDDGTAGAEESNQDDDSSSSTCESVEFVCPFEDQPNCNNIVESFLSIVREDSSLVDAPKFQNDTASNILMGMLLTSDKAGVNILSGNQAVVVDIFQDPRTKLYSIVLQYLSFPRSLLYGLGSIAADISIGKTVDSRIILGALPADGKLLYIEVSPDMETFTASQSKRRLNPRYCIRIRNVNVKVSITDIGPVKNDIFRAYVDGTLSETCSFNGNLISTTCGTHMQDLLKGISSDGEDENMFDACYPQQMTQIFSASNFASNVANLYFILTISHVRSFTSATTTGSVTTTGNDLSAGSRWATLLIELEGITFVESPSSSLKGSTGRLSYLLGADDFTVQVKINDDNS